MEFMHHTGTIRAGELRVAHVDRYLARLDELGLSRSTRKRKAIIFRWFLSFLFRNGYISHDIVEKVILPLPDQPFPRILTQLEYQKLLTYS
jgi:site-specific recombinase XerD